MVVGDLMIHIPPLSTFLPNTHTHTHRESESAAIY